MSSVSRTDSRSRIDRGIAEILAYNREMALALPPADETFALQETDLNRGDLNKLIEIDAISRAERERLTSAAGTDYTRWRWRTEERVHQWIEQYFDTDIPECPAEGCRATGVHTLEAGERFTCTNEDCPETFGPETAEELIHR